LVSTLKHDERDELIIEFFGLRSCMHNLRNKLDSAGILDLIKTIQGSGYLLSKAVYRYLA
jgi:DNA-binding response OmpR family regulator